jgi:signal transduction histidine kinase
MRGKIGFGLTIVKELAERHGGSVSLTNRSPQGLRALLVLPSSARPR